MQTQPRCKEIGFKGKARAEGPSVVSVAGGFGGRESRAKTSGATTGGNGERTATVAASLKRLRRENDIFEI